MDKNFNVPFTIRIARIEDAEQILNVYSPYVIKTAITFEHEVPTLSDISQRIENTIPRYPYLVAENQDGKLLGYAYASKLKERAAYDWAAELSIYIAKEHHRCGIGEALLHSIESCLIRQNITNLNACISYSETEDELHNNDSLRFHKRLGFEKVAHFHKCGYKFGQWWDIIWMEKFISSHQRQQPDFIPFSQLVNEKGITL